MKGILNPSRSSLLKLITALAKSSNSKVDKFVSTFDDKSANKKAIHDFIYGTETNQ